MLKMLEQINCNGDDHFITAQARSRFRTATAKSDP